MVEKFKNKYRIQSHRMPGWDYSNNGIYFLTIVTQNRKCIMGNVIIDKNTHPYVSLSDFGKIVNNEWIQSFEIRDEIFLDTYIIMPNHIHAIVVLNKNKMNDTHNMDEMHNVGGTHVETHGRASLRANRSKQQNQFVRKPKSISSFIGGFKSAVNSKIDDFIDQNNLDIPKYNRDNHFFQSNYHDHIIRNNAEYERIKKYIINNPLKWDNDKFNPDLRNQT